jgi:V-type H+-transporting ATPase subunit E
MQSSLTTQLIAKMKASIKHQATTTANQIKDQAAQDADRAKTRTVYNAKIKIKDENKLKKKQILSQKSVRLSVVNGSERMKILRIRDDAVNKAVDRAADKLREFSQKPEYRQLLHDLCLQGLIALNEPEVALAVKAGDQDLIREILPELKATFGGRIGQDAQLTLSDYVLPDAAIGGCVLIAMGGKIQCSNTLMDRLMLACKDMYPQIQVVFGATNAGAEPA